jgi:Trk-type K+ transport system membrane component
VRWRYIINITGILIFFFGLTMVVPLLVGLYYHDQSVIPLLKSMGLTVAAGLSLYFIFKSSKAEQPAGGHGYRCGRMDRCRSVWRVAILFRQWF